MQFAQNLVPILKQFNNTTKTPWDIPKRTIYELFASSDKALWLIAIWMTFAKTTRDVNKKVLLKSLLQDRPKLLRVNFDIWLVTQN